MSQRKRIVVKIGSSLLAHDCRLTLRYAFMNELLADIARLRDEGHDVVLASSGAVALGLNAINTSPEEAGVLDKQAAAACGQPLLLNAYKQVAHEHGFDIAQILVTLDDLEERRRFLNTKNTIQRLFERDVMPIVNENDTVTTEEIRVGDNDRLAAKVAQMIQADHLVILTSIDGLYDRDPSDPEAEFVDTIEDVTEYLEVTSGTSSLGSGGMLTKIQAANLAQNAGCTTLIAEGTIDRPVSAVLSGERRHTKCVAKGTPASSWAVWLTNRLQRAGSLVLNDVAAEVLATSASGVSHEDIVKIHGAFTKGDVLHIYSESGDEVARGLTNFSSDETMMLARHTDQDVKELLGYHARPEIVNRANMVILDEQHLPWDAPTKSLRLVSS
ncbi:glutamate 5-kinase [Maricaulis sp.]|uniref:glutamate 5-kinase n=1 Tax=Maricaulis sp. TaxID=1486257 RepID=UPI0025F80577|nr:glutamate 5-kinase [Maricaulis sp.]MDF1767965.1 glutamate 5-kinase [Maricaulis sp.]